MSANLVEIFSSVQGEGPDVGASTLFVRFGGCDLRCRWCDSPHTWRPAERCRIETARGTGASRFVPNPIEMALPWDEALPRLRTHPEYPDLFEQAFGTIEITEGRVVKAIAQTPSLG